MWKYWLASLAAITVLVLLYKYFYGIDGFIASDGCPGSSILDPVAGACRDPDCKPGQKNTRGPSGMLCVRTNFESTTFTPSSQADCPSGTTFNSTSKSCQVCTTLPNGTTECRSGGAYDNAKPDRNYQGSINTETVKTDVLTEAGKIDYSDWVDDYDTSSDIRGSGGESSFLNTHYTGRNRISENNVDDPIDELEDYYKETINERNSDDGLDELEDQYGEYKSSRKSIQDLINARKRSDKNNSWLYDRYMERPSDMEYDDYYDDEYYYDDETEGFVTESKMIPDSNMLQASKMIPDSNMLKASKMIPDSNMLQASKMIPDSNMLQASKMPSGTKMLQPSKVLQLPKMP